jgi:hypothetical protein
VTNHERMEAIFKPFKGQTFKTSEIKTMLKGFVAPGSVLPNDHAHGNKGACTCARSEARLFDKLERGVYRVR